MGNNQIMPTESGDKEKKSKASLSLLGNSLIDSIVERFSGGKNEKRNRFILLLITTFLLTLLLIPGHQYISVKYKAGDIATSDIRASQDYLLEDRPLTEKKRGEAAAAAPYVYKLHPNTSTELSRRFEHVLALVNEAKSQEEAIAEEPLRQAVVKNLGVEITPAELWAFASVKSDRVLISDISHLLDTLYRQKIVADKKGFAIDVAHGVLVINQETDQDVAAGDYSSYLDLADAAEYIADIKLVQGAPRRTLDIIKGVLARAVIPSISFDREATERKKLEARNAVRPVLFQLKRGEMIVRVGERITPEQVMKLEKIFETSGFSRIFTGLGMLSLVLVLFYFPYRFARKNIRKFNPSNKDILLLSLLTVVNFLLLKLTFVVSSVMGGLFPYISTTAYYYLFPFAASAIIVRIILNSEVALVYTAVCAPLFGIMYSNSLPIVIYALLGGIVGAHGVRQCKDRGTIYTAGVKVSVVNIAMAFSFQIFSDGAVSMQTLYCCVFAAAGGLINAIYVSGTVPLIEGLFKYTTDIKLLELSNLNSPILRELMIRAPGTYHHSVVVGSLVEAGAEAINANPLLARVAAYYHDVGKISKPLYFIENVKGGENRHDKLSPSMSALILISHVKEGVELAKENRLGQPIIDIIRQSHGTSLITYFYQKAKNSILPDTAVTDERDFRYPGPKPQTREAGLVLLADCVEAASRTLTDPTPARIQGMVQKIISNIFIDGQLDECELTLKNLHEIAKRFNQVLSGIYHQRIDYPEPAYKGSGGKKAGEDSDNEQPKAAPDLVDTVKKGGGEDIRRLGMS
jgi:putative nucleotidyltransferase with HDIG domain